MICESEKKKKKNLRDLSVTYIPNSNVLCSCLVKFTWYNWHKECRPSNERGSDRVDVVGPVRLYRSSRNYEHAPTNSTKKREDGGSIRKLAGCATFTKNSLIIKQHSLKLRRITRLCFAIRKNLPIRELFVYEPIKKDPKLFDSSPS